MVWGGGYSVSLAFYIGLHSKDINLLENIRNFFGVGIISKHGSNVIHYTVSRRVDLAKIIAHFDQYPLCSNKLADYILFKEALSLLNQKVHLTKEVF